MDAVSFMGERFAQVNQRHLVTSDDLDLTKAFMQIADAKIRRSIIKPVEEVADTKVSLPTMAGHRSRRLMRRLRRKNLEPWPRPQALDRVAIPGRPRSGAASWADRTARREDAPHQRASSKFCLVAFPRSFRRFPRLGRRVLLSANSTSDTANDSHVAPKGVAVRKFLMRSTTALAIFSLVGAISRLSKPTLSSLTIFPLSYFSKVEIAPLN
jgi:hypothetical protein